MTCTRCSPPIHLPGRRARGQELPAPPVRGTTGVALGVDHGRMPELPGVEARAASLRESAAGRVATRVALAAAQAIKTFDPPLSALAGLELTGASRHGKFL